MECNVCYGGGKRQESTFWCEFCSINNTDDSISHVHYAFTHKIYIIFAVA